MASGPLSTPGAKSALILSIGMMMVGFWGVLGAVQHLGGGVDRIAMRDGQVPAEVEAAVDAINEDLRRSPVLRAADVGNLLASGLLLVASVMLSTRRESSVWWARQALLANALHALGAGAALASLAWEHGHRFMVPWITSGAAGELPAGTSVEENASAGVAVLGATFLGIYGLIATGYLVARWWAGRPKVRAFLERRPAPDADA